MLLRALATFICFFVSSPVFAALTLPERSFQSQFTMSWDESLVVQPAPGVSATHWVKVTQQGQATPVIDNAPLKSSLSLTRSRGSYTYTLSVCFRVTWGQAGYQEGCQQNAVKTILVVDSRPLAVPVLTLPTTSNSGSFTLSWTGALDAETYEWQQQTNNGTWSAFQSVTTPSKTFSLSNDLYAYRVRACNRFGCTASSSAKTITVVKTPPVPGSISAPASSDTGAISVSWSASGGTVNYYQLELNQNNAWSKVYQGSATAYSLTLGVGTYSYRVRACAEVSGVASCSGWRTSGNSTVTSPSAFSFSQAPATFTYDPNSFPLLNDFAGSDFVAITQGDVDVDNGAVRYSVPIVLPPTLNNHAPSLALTYSSANKSGTHLGVGWYVSGVSSIARCRTSFAEDGSQATKSNPAYSKGDRLCLNGQKLFLRGRTGSATDAEYWVAGAEYVEEQDSFNKIVANADFSEFKVYGKNGLIYYYGGTSGDNALYYRSGSGSDVHKWMLAKVEDRYGNFYSFDYEQTQSIGEHYLKRVNLASNAHVEFDYVVRDNDEYLVFHAGGQRSITHLLRSVTTYVGSSAVRHYDLQYERSQASNQYLVSQISECGYDVAGIKQCARPLTFAWTKGQFGFDKTPRSIVACQTGSEINVEKMQFDDLNSDGYVDIRQGQKVIAWGSSAACFTTVSDTVIPSKDAVPIQTAKGLAFVWYKDLVTAYPSTNSSINFYQKNYSSNTTTVFQIAQSAGERHMVVADFNNDALTDICYDGKIYSQYTESSSGAARFNAATSSECPQNHDRLKSYLAVDSTGNGLADITGYNNSLDYTGDFNGDGWIDIVRKDKLIANDHTRFARAPVTTNVAIGNAGPIIMDINKDGLDDALMTYYADTVNKRQIITEAFGVNRNGQPGLTYERVYPAISQYLLNGIMFDTAVNQFFSYSGGNFIRGDINNDGLVDFYHPEQNKAYYARRGQPDLLQSVTDGFGAEVIFEYSELVGDSSNGKPFFTPSPTPAQFPFKPVSRQMQVLKTLKTSNGAGGYLTTWFHYTGGKVDITGRGFTGFEKVEVTDEMKGLVQTTRYRLDWPFTGLASSEEARIVEGVLLNRSSYSYKIHPQNARFVYGDSVINERFDAQPAPISVAKTLKNYDALGCSEDETLIVGTGLSGSNVTGELGRTVTDHTPVNNTADWLICFVGQTQVTYEKAGGVGRRSYTHSYQPEPGTLDTKTATLYKNTSVQSATTVTRNAQGITTSTETSAADAVVPASAARMAEIKAFEDGFYPLTVHNAAGHVTTQKYDKRFGLLRYTRDPNGLESSVVYDALGRAMEENGPTGTLTRLQSYYCATAPVTCPAEAVYVTAQLITHTGEQNRLGAPLTVRYFDLLQREIRTETFSLDGTSVKQDRFYDDRGRLQQESEPYVDYPQFYTTYARYNALGEAVEIHSPDGGQITIENTQEGVLFVTETTMDVANSNSTQQQINRRYTNALGQLVQAEDALGQVIDYTYDSQGHLTGTTMNGDALTRVTLQHDVAGNKTYLQDPAAGKIHYVYNGFGELRQQIWQKDTSAQKSQRFDYDILGRQTHRVDTAVGGASTTATWVYDTLKKGLPTSQSGNGYSETFAYNSLTQITGQTVVLDGLGSKTFSHTYDGFGRAKTLTYPSGLKVEQVYHAAGVPVQTLDATTASAKKVLWAMGDTQDEQGHYTLQILGNGVVTEKTFDPLNGRLQGIVSGRVSGTQMNLIGTLQNLSYDWDSLGNLQYRQSRRLNASGSATENLKEGFEYDDLNRLDFASTAGLSLTPRTRDYQYDGYGNLRHNGVAELRYERTNGASVYGVTTGNSKTYRYDTYGNVIQRGSEIYEYNVFNKPTKLHNTNFRYGPNQEKYWQSEGGVITWTFAGGLYEVVQNGSTVTEKSYAGAYLQLKTGSTITHRYMLQDHLGSVETVTDELGRAIERMSFEPFGTRQQADWQTGTPSNVSSFATKKGFTGHDMLDSMGLIHMGGRVYDPVVGRFLSADLFVHSAADTQSYNRYSYVRNNPLSAIDPTGYAEDKRCKTARQCDRGSEAEARRAQELLGVDKDQEGGEETDPKDDFIKAQETLSKLAKKAGRSGISRIITKISGKWYRVTYSAQRAKKEINASADTGIPVNEIEQAALNRGDLGTYYQSRLDRGDPYGAIGLSFWAPESDGAIYRAMAVASKLNLLAGAIANGVITSSDPMTQQMQLYDIGVALARAHAASVNIDYIDKLGDISGVLDLQQVTDFHHDVFKSYGIPVRYYGGTPVGGYEFEAHIVNWIFPFYESGDSHHEK